MVHILVCGIDFFDIKTHNEHMRNNLQRLKHPMRFNGMHCGFQPHRIVMMFFTPEILTRFYL